MLLVSLIPQTGESMRAHQPRAIFSSLGPAKEQEWKPPIRFWLVFLFELDVDALVVNIFRVIRGIIRCVYWKNVCHHLNDLKSAIVTLDIRHLDVPRIALARKAPFVGIEVVSKHTRVVEKIRRAAFVGRIIHALAVDGGHSLRIHKLSVAVFCKRNTKVTRVRNELVDGDVHQLSRFVHINIRAFGAILAAAGALLDFRPSIAGFVCPGFVHIKVSQS